eukprot:gene5383-7463_t
MGNTSILSTGAVLVVQLDQTHPIHGGSSLRGTILLDIQKPTISADNLSVRFYGMESTCVEYQETVGSGDNQHTETKHVYESAIIVDIKYHLMIYPGSISQGRYAYPFEIAIPPGLPGKQGAKAGGSWFVVEYFFEAKLDRHGLMTWDVENFQEILMGDPPYPIIRTPSFAEPLIFPMFFFCCIHTGTATLIGNVDSTTAAVGAPVKVAYAIHNESTSTIKALEVRIVKVMSFRAHGHHEYTSIAVPPGNLRINAEQLVGIAKSNQVAPVDYLEVANNLRNNMYSVDVTIPSYERPSYHGKLGSVSYKVEIQIKTPFCVDDPTMTIPMNVIRNGATFQGVVPAVKYAVQMPPDWQPATQGQMVHFGATSTLQQLPQQMMNNSQPQQQYQQQQQYQPQQQFQPQQQQQYQQQQPGYQQQQQQQQQAPQQMNNNSSNSVGYLLQKLQSSDYWSEITILSEWIAQPGASNQLTPETLSQLFHCIKGDYSYTMFPEIIGQAMEGRITTVHICSCATAVLEQHKAPVISSFARFCIDKQNARQAFSTIGLTPYSLSTALLYY